MSVSLFLFLPFICSSFASIVYIDDSCVNPKTGITDVRVNCLLAPCVSQKTCEAFPEATCEDNYCGGCHAIWRDAEQNTVSCDVVVDVIMDDAVVDDNHTPTDTVPDCPEVEEWTELIGEPCTRSAENCFYGEEACCGETFPSGFCNCIPNDVGSEEGIFQCGYTDACLGAQMPGGCDYEDECNIYCPLDYSPVCAVNGELHETFPNECALEYRQCDDRVKGLDSFTKECTGECPCPPEDTVEDECNPVCPEIYQPLCGSDGNTYDNQCSLEYEKCSKADESLIKDCQGPCPCAIVDVCTSDCPEIYRPVCGSDGVTYDNLCSLEFAKCSTKPRLSNACPGQCPCDNDGPVEQECEWVESDVPAFCTNSLVLGVDLDLDSCLEMCADGCSAVTFWNQIGQCEKCEPTSEIILFSQFSSAQRLSVAQGFGPKLFTKECSDAVPVQQKELSDNIALWESCDTSCYSYDLMTSCYCLPDWTLPKHVVVNNDVIQVTYIRDGSPAVDTYSHATIPEWFSYVEDLIARSGEANNIEYDSECGFPVLIDADPVPGAIDDEVVYELNNFQIGECEMQQDQKISELERNKELWATCQSDCYNFDFIVSCFCAPDYTTLKHAVVSDDDVQVTLQDGTIAPGNSYLYSTIDDFFDLIENTLASNGDVTVEYDETCGFPISIDSDPILQTVDDESYITISNVELGVCEFVEQSAEQQKLARNRELWRACNMRCYSYDIEPQCRCTPAFRELKTVSVNAMYGSAQAISSSDGSIVSAANSPEFLTIPEAFDFISELLMDPNSDATVTYDAECGYPLEIVADRIVSAIDDEVTYVMSNFVDGDCPIITHGEDCNSITCNTIYNPVCASNGVTYSNDCQLGAAECRNFQFENIVKTCNGVCPCTDDAEVDLCKDFTYFSCNGKGDVCPQGSECRVYPDAECRSTGCTCDPPTGLQFCTPDCNGGVCTPIEDDVAEKDLCEDFTFSSCNGREDVCPLGTECRVYPDAVCTPSTCTCDPQTGERFCTADCNGGVCMPLESDGDDESDSEPETWTPQAILDDPLAWFYHRDEDNDSVLTQQEVISAFIALSAFPEDEMVSIITALWIDFDADGDDVIQFDELDEPNGILETIEANFLVVVDEPECPESQPENGASCDASLLPAEACQYNPIACCPGEKDEKIVYGAFADCFEGAWRLAVARIACPACKSDGVGSPDTDLIGGPIVDPIIDVRVDLPDNCPDELPEQGSSCSDDAPSTPGECEYSPVACCPDSLDKKNMFSQFAVCMENQWNIASMKVECPVCGPGATCPETMPAPGSTCDPETDASGCEYQSITCCEGSLNEESFFTAFADCASNGEWMIAMADVFCGDCENPNGLKSNCPASLPSEGSSCDDTLAPTSVEDCKYSPVACCPDETDQKLVMSKSAICIENQWNIAMFKAQCPQCDSACEKACTREYSPVCGSDGQTYSNNCLWEIENCKNPSILKSCGGACPCQTIDGESDAENDDDMSQSAYITEIHYDNPGPDVGEFVEVRICSGDVNSYEIRLYNGADAVRQSYATLNLGENAVLGAEGYYVVDFPQDGLQNGPDGVMLIKNLENGEDEVVEFLSYEGSFTTNDKLSATSTDVGVMQDHDTVDGESLQRVDIDEWILAANTRGEPVDDSGFPCVEVDSPVTPAVCPEVCEDENKITICYPDEDGIFNLICAHVNDLPDFYANGGLDHNIAANMLDCDCNAI